ncbi:hypothetical protein TMUPMC115_0476 [Tetragenococcus muriaticus PMC-11-5]|uniref:Uncharacterized protein n=1 Tax=Tetragenococcus muriaticus PMC-11-5 TaxID=1302649 RepID=A0A091C971_9ENTE|nr:hypothetical protein [Tetragenococcus muriaticus]KFN93340.1 hypothetical protein TMUPMC115_0476 [Tetragenococcus muriaticus PMC-11-5]GMA45834.1 hypothetical protein GCM10025854_00810 [Tetragenococcus muriaticus]GMA45952.1 hypothetical protein GCM10025854_02000 [Tetragenococcus muriaticus]GMA46125.1 hypothetical protein GCM10025854_03740 [Tetragenococcus muriaticus]GMA46270.1 hypothetical protein GCM10025854_05190 [Tetragenococcus muriaticus]
MIGRRRATNHWAQASKKLRTGQKAAPKQKKLSKQQNARRRGTLAGAIRSAFKK